MEGVRFVYSSSSKSGVSVSVRFQVKNEPKKKEFMEKSIGTMKICLSLSDGTLLLSVFLSLSQV